MQRQLGEIVLRVRDMPRMLRFYRDILQLPLLRNIDNRYVFFRIADGLAGHTQVLALFDQDNPGNAARGRLLPPDPASTSLHHFAISVTQAGLAAEHKRLQQAGLEITTADHAWVGWRSFYVNDPEQNTVEFVCFDARVLQK